MIKLYFSGIDYTDALGAILGTDSASPLIPIDSIHGEARSGSSCATAWWLERTQSLMC